MLPLHCYHTFSFQGTIADGYFRDLRYFYLYCLILLTVSITLWKKIHRQVKKKMDIGLYWLILFILFSYVFAQIDFGSIRYILVMEMLSPLIIYLLLKRLIKNERLQNYTSIILFVIMIVTLVPVDHGSRIRLYQPSFFGVIPPRICQ